MDWISRLKLFVWPVRAQVTSLLFADDAVMLVRQTMNFSRHSSSKNDSRRSKKWWIAPSVLGVICCSKWGRSVLCLCSSVKVKLSVYSTGILAWNQQKCRRCTRRRRSFAFRLSSQFRPIYIPVHTNGWEIWVGTERKKNQKSVWLGSFTKDKKLRHQKGVRRASWGALEIW